MTTTRESLATAKELFRKITSRVDVAEVLEIAIALDTARQEAELKEREACAKVADDRSHDADWSDSHDDRESAGDSRAKEIAATIRNRGK